MNTLRILQKVFCIIGNNTEAFHESLGHKNQHFKNRITNNSENLEVLVINIIVCNNVIHFIIVNVHMFFQLFNIIIILILTCIIFIIIEI
jgi:hypothetical protein